MQEIWIVGATGRIGRAMSARLAPHHALVLAGRDPRRLHELAASVDGHPRTVAADSVESLAAELAGSAPAVVVNLIGPFARTGPPLIQASPPGTHYVDLANELFAVTGLLARHDEAVESGRTLVTGAGFGVLATESVVLRMVADQPAPARVRVDAMPMIDTEPGVVGTALAGTIVAAFAPGGRRYEQDRLVRTGIGADLEQVTRPDGTVTHTGAVPMGELEAARRASGAPAVTAASSEVPASRALRAALPAASALLSRPALRSLAARALARARVTPRAHDTDYSWARARIEDRNGAVREGWLRAGEGMAFTVAVASEVADRLAHGSPRPGAYTPGALFGADLAEQVGGRFILDDSQDETMSL